MPKSSALKVKLATINDDVAQVKINHTEQTYSSVDEAYQFFNKALFGDRLPYCLITMQRSKKARGYFSRDRFVATYGENAGKLSTDEIALNPQAFLGREQPEVLSTLVHEMVHLWQFHFGEPSRTGYHNHQWAEEMKRVGLYPSDTGLAGGKETGQHMTHYILPEGAFAKACANFLAKRALVLYSDKARDSITAKKKSESKTKFTCETCGCNAWGKPDLNLVCGSCDETMLTGVD